MKQFMEKEPVKKFLSIFRNEKFLKYVPMLNAIYFIGGTFLWVYCLVFVLSESKATLEDASRVFKEIMIFPPSVAFIAYIFAVLSYNKKQFMCLVRNISFVMIFFILIGSKNVDDFSMFELGSIHILGASLFWGAVGLCLSEQCFLTHEVTKTTQRLRILFCSILLFTYFSNVLSFLYFYYEA